MGKPKIQNGSANYIPFITWTLLLNKLSNMNPEQTFQRFLLLLKYLTIAALLIYASEFLIGCSSVKKIKNETKENTVEKKNDVNIKQSSKDSVGEKKIDIKSLNIKHKRVDTEEKKENQSEYESKTTVKFKDGAGTFVFKSSNGEKQDYEFGNVAEVINESKGKNKSNETKNTKDTTKETQETNSQTKENSKVNSNELDYNAASSILQQSRTIKFKDVKKTGFNWFNLFWLMPVLILIAIWKRKEIKSWIVKLIFPRTNTNTNA